jgi:hypothetical protein
MTTTQIITVGTQGGYSYDLEIGRCANCHGRIERPVGRSGAEPTIRWAHEATSRTTCLLPADTSKVATPA